MNKAELADCVAENSSLNRSQAAEAVDAVLDCITNTLAGGEKVTLVNFGTFAVSQRAARTGRNPQTGATIQIAARNAPSFKAGKSLKDAVN